ncbi:hypothetical protein TNCV_946231 [Trichonephila clavipes]|nr:hypothetical protein TNCV_946231 [Trichonephila clavipes]
MRRIWENEFHLPVPLRLSTTSSFTNAPKSGRQRTALTTEMKITVLWDNVQSKLSEQPDCSRKSSGQMKAVLNCTVMSTDITEETSRVIITTKLNETGVPVCGGWSGVVVRGGGAISGVVHVT